MKKTIYFIRHGETDFNRKHIIQGSGVDSELNDLGHQQANAFHQHYQNLDFEIVLTSALQRTHQTVGPFIKKGISWEQHVDINELNWGVHEGRPSEPWMVEAYKKLIEEWKSGNFSAALEEGESAQSLAERCGRFVEHLKTRREKLILVCSHGRALRCLMCCVKGQHLREMESYSHSNTGLFKVHFEAGEYRVELENDTQHLSESAIEKI